MSDLEVAKLYTVTDPLDRPVRELISGQTTVDIQFNPSSLKVSLANSLKENERNGNTRAAQFVDKSSSNLTVELIFDTSDQYFTRENDQGSEEEVQKDVRTLTKPIATTFMASDSIGDDTVAPQRCLFAWGTFAFVGIMESFDETLDFFSPKGTPLRATVAIKLSESRFQFRTEEAKASERDTPSLGSGSPAQANSNEGKKDKDWRDTAMYNGVESPRTAGENLSVPTASATASLQASASASIGGGISGGFGAGISAGGGLGIGGGLSAGAGISGGLSAGVSGGISAGAGIGGGLSAGISGGIGGGVSAGVSGGVDISGGLSAGITSDLGGITASAKITPPSFSFGASKSVGTSIPGAFSPNLNAVGGLTAGSIVSGGVSLNGGGVSSTVSTSKFSSSSFSTSSVSASSNASVSAEASIGFD